MALTKTAKILRSIRKETENYTSYGWLPINLSVKELEEVLQEHFKGKRKYSVQRAISCLSSLLIIRYNTAIKYRTRAWYIGYTNISRNVFVEWVGTDYKDYINALLDGGILETDNCYVVKRKSKGYKIKTYYTTPEDGEWRKFYRVAYTDDSLIIRAYNARKLRQAKCSGLKARKELDEICQVLAKTVDLDTARQDMDALAKMYGDSYRIGKRSLFECFYQLERLKSGDVIYNPKDDFGYRFHTAITNLPSSLRKYILVNGQPPCEVDFSNSNAFYFGCIAKYPDAILRLRGSNIDEDVVRKISSYYQNGASDYVEFVDEALKGKLYEFIMERVETIYKPIDRKEAKSLVMKFMNSNDKQYVKLKQRIGFVLPSIVEVCNSLNANEAKAIPMILQRVEATIILDNIVPALIDNSQYPFTTIHDSFLCSKEDKPLVIHLIEETHTRLGLPVPQIKE
ncbi:MAG: hypothetical protein EOO89_00345 [Pedobacter sp.]|nr:MAG: hypothetical protein EOO89_00345 [Pedobacter sp.]